MKAPQQINHKSIIEQPLEQIMGERFGAYSKYIIQDRALPDARDGLKPVQRRILYAMYTDGNRYDKSYRKSAKTVGLVIGNYHPHGDTSVYDAMVRMSQEWKIRNPQIDMQGNNGSIDDDPAAAMRYTEARLSRISEYLLEDIDKDTVSWSLNFDDTDYEPTVLPARYPNLLVNGITGIAAGYATNIPPHNLGEVIDAAIYRIQYPQCTLSELMEYIQGPDFPTGGIVQGKQGIIDAFTNGKGRIMIRAKTEIVQTKTCQQLIVHEIPYEVIKSSMVKKIDDVRLNKRIDGILDVRDESDRNGLRVVVDIRKDADAQLILNYLYKNTDLQVSYNYNVIAIVNKRPMQLGLAQMLDAFINHRQEVVVRRSHYELDKKQKRCHILEGLIQAISVLDEVIALIRVAKDKADSKVKLIDRFAFSEDQAEAIVTMRLYRLSNTDVTLLRQEHDTLLEEIAYLQDILANEKLLKRVMIQELKEVRKEFPTPRLTKIENEIEEIVIDKVSMIASEQVMVTLSRDGYMKRVSMRSYGASSDAASGCKEGDVLIGSGEVNTLDHLLFFTTQGTYGYLQAYEAEEAKWKDVGAHMNNTIRISGEEKLTNAYVLSDFQTHAYIISVSKLGMIKKTALREYEVSRRNKTMANMKLSEDDRCIASLLAYEGDEVMLCSTNGYITRYPIALIPATAPKSKGVKAMNLSQDTIASACIYHGDAAQLLVVSDQCAMKRIKLSEIDLTGRPVKGNMICKRVKSNPYHIHTIRLYDMNEEVKILANEPQTLLMKDVSLMSREATFSQPVQTQNEFMLASVMERIKQVPLPKQTEKTMEFEEMNLDL